MTATWVNLHATGGQTAEIQCPPKKTPQTKKTPPFCNQFLPMIRKSYIFLDKLHFSSFMYALLVYKEKKGIFFF